MNATDELRRLLTEAGVEWDADDEIMDDGSTSQVTYWHSNDIEWSADGRDEYLAFDAVQLITPEQAIAATLGDADLAAENAKLRELATETWELLTCNEPVFVWKGLQELARNLGIEVDG